MQIAIESMAAYAPATVLALRDLARARGIDAAKYEVGLGCLQMAVPGPGEDAVTLAASAARELIVRGLLDPADVGMLVVGTESGIDHSTSVAVHVHGLLGLPRACRTLEVKQACYGATGGLLLARDWVAARPPRKALVIASDIARYAPGSAGEPTQGAGAVAMVVAAPADSNQAVLTLDPWTGMCAQQADDFWRPLYRWEALVDGKYSVENYLDTLRAALAEYEADRGEPLPEPDTLLYHCPFPKMAIKAHRAYLEARGVAREHWDRDLARRVEPALHLNRQVGNLYTGSLYLALIGWVSTDPTPGALVGLFSYGSGSCGEFFSGRLCDGARARVVPPDLQHRRAVSVAEYETLSAAARDAERDGSYPIPPAGDRSGTFLFAGIREHRRIYEVAAASYQSRRTAGRYPPAAPRAAPDRIPA